MTHWFVKGDKTMTMTEKKTKVQDLFVPWLTHRAGVQHSHPR